MQTVTVKIHTRSKEVAKIIAVDRQKDATRTLWRVIDCWREARNQQSINRATRFQLPHQVVKFASIAGRRQSAKANAPALKQIEYEPKMLQFFGHDFRQLAAKFDTVHVREDQVQRSASSLLFAVCMVYQNLM